MSSIDTVFNGARVANAVNFSNLPLLNNLYIFLGEAAAPDSNDPSPATNVIYEKFTRSGIFYLQRLLTTDMVLVVPKINWQVGTVYTQYSSTDANLFSKNFYTVIANNVYKCLSNNNGAASSQPPTGTSIFPFILSDGYEWKFMYNLSDIIQANFTIDQYMPVPIGSQKTTQQMAVEAAASPTTDSPSGGHGSNAYLELGASNIMVSKGIIFSSVSANPVTQGQFGLLLNPLFIDGVALTDTAYVVDNTINLSSGILLQVEKHAQIVSSIEDNAEILQFVLSF